MGASGPIHRSPSVRRGFTLIELLVVIAVIAILAAILFPVFAQAKRAAKKTGCLSHLKQIGTAMTIYQADYDDGYPNTGDPYLWAGRRFRWPIMPYLGVGQQLVSGGFDASSRSALLLCPEDSSSGTSFDATSYAYSAAFYLPAEVSPQLTIRNLISSLNSPGLAANTVTQTSSAVANPAGKAMVTEWFNSHDTGGGRTVGFWGTLKPGLIPGDDRWLGGRNFTFADSHAKFIKATRQTPSSDDCPDFNRTPGGISGTDLSGL